MKYATSTIVAIASTFSLPTVTCASKLNFPSHLVHAGACMLGEELLMCAMTSSACAGGLKYVSFRQLLQDFENVGNSELSTYDPAAANGIKHVLNACAGQHSKTNHPAYTGMCTSDVDGFQCTSHKSNCFHPDKFVPDVPYCSLQYNYWSERDAAVSLYGSCVPIVGSGQDSRLDYTNVACVWSEQDCPTTTNQFMVASQYSGLQSGESYEELCTCDKVMTGACVDRAGKNAIDSGKNDFTWFQCAVSADSCDDESEFIPWQQVQYAGRDCRLCDDFDKTKEVAMGNLIKNQPHSTSNGSVPTNSHDQDVATDTEGKNCNFNSSTSIQSPNHNKHIGKSIGIAIGGLVIGVVLTLLVVLSSKRYRLSSKTVNKKGKMNKKDVVNDGDKKPDDDSEIDAVDFKLENGIMS